MQIPNMGKVRNKKFDDKTYEIRRIGYVVNADGVFYDLSNDKTKVSFITYVEMLIRQSYEYKMFIKTLKEDLDMNTCTYFHNINISMKIGIEMHHSPFTLFDICLIMLNKFMEEDIAIDPFELAKAVMYEHFVGRVGLLPLCKTVHELVHAGQIIIPITYVFGDVGEFYRKNWQYLTETQKESLNKLISVTTELESTVPTVLNKKFIYLDIDGMRLPKAV